MRSCTSRPKDQKKIKLHRTLRFWFIGVSVLLLSIATCATAVFFIIISQVAFIHHMFLNIMVKTVAMALCCIIIGFVISFFSSNKVMYKINSISNGMAEISKGNFKVRVEEHDKDDMPTEFGELERAFNKMAQDLDGLEMFRSDFINNFSHEFKTPIVSIRGFARQLQNPNLSEEEKQEYISILVSESERLTKMSSNILLLTKLENQQIVSEKTDFYLDEQIRKCILLLEKSWEEKNIEFNLDSLSELKYNFNEEMLSQVWINLISNSIKFSNENGIITICLYKRENNAVIIVSDNGIGMSEEVKARIFEKFYHGDKSHNGSGNGIGLNIVSRIITLANGEITVESEENVGSTFTVILPLDEE